VTGSPGAVAARLHGVGDVRVAPEPVEAPRPGEVLLRVAAVGLCGSDLHWYREAAIGDAPLEKPLVLGHEFAAVIVDGPRAGERVVADPADACERCEACRAGRPNVCSAGRFAGFAGTDGALRSLMPWPERLLHRVPDGIGNDEAALLEPLGVAIHAVDLGSVPDGGRVGVFGCGPLGLLLVQLLRVMGATVVVATDRLPHRVEAARLMGATMGLVVTDDGPLEGGFAEGSGGGTVDVAFEAAGEDGALADAIAAVAPAGRVVVVGIPEGDRTSFPAGLARRKEVSLQLCRRMVPSDLPRAIAIAEAGRIDLDGLISDRLAIDDAPEAFRIAASRRGHKVVVRPNATSTREGD
jgi:L-iditol 2-dehydrogenase